MSQVTVSILKYVIKCAIVGFVLIIAAIVTRSLSFLFALFAFIAAILLFGYAIYIFIMAYKNLLIMVDGLCLKVEYEKNLLRRSQFSGPDTAKTRNTLFSPFGKEARVKSIVVQTEDHLVSFNIMHRYKFTLEEGDRVRICLLPQTPLYTADDGTLIARSFLTIDPVYTAQSDEEGKKGA